MLNYLGFNQSKPTKISQFLSKSSSTKMSGFEIVFGNQTLTLIIHCPDAEVGWV